MAALRFVSKCKEFRMKILVSYNGTKESEAALELAKSHAKIFDAKLVIISSSEGGKGEKPEVINKIQHDLESIQENISEEGLECEVEQLARGLTPGEDIVLYAEENDIDQIYVGIRKKSRTSKLILGSTAQFIILKAKCPVTSVK
jgi:nucleotide-binding universal stress UspA family protein